MYCDFERVLGVSCLVVVVCVCWLGGRGHPGALVYITAGFGQLVSLKVLYCCPS